MDWNGRSVVDAYWLMAGRSYADQSIGKERLIGVCDTFAVAQVITEHRRAYEFIESAKLAGASTIKVVPNPKQCPICRATAGHNENVLLLLEAFRNGTPPFPHEISTPDDNDFCPAPTLLPALEPSPGDDLDFHKWLVKTLGGCGDVSM
jgi:hypothetical protein